MQLFVADETLGSTCDNAAIGEAVFGEPAYLSLTLVLDVLALPTTCLQSLQGLKSMSVQCQVDPSPRLVIVTKHLRITFIPLTSTGAPAMIVDPTTAQPELAGLQLLSIDALTDTSGTINADVRVSPRTSMGRTARS